MRTGRFLLAAGAVALATAALAAPSGAGEQDAAPLTIEKVIVGTPPPGTQFVVEFNCENGNNTLDQVTFDEFGEPVGPNTTFFLDPDECAPTETQTGGASSVSYACEGTIPNNSPPTVPQPPESGDWPVTQGGRITDPCAAAGPQSEPITVFIVAEGQDATVTVTNTFLAPEPAPVVVEPSFTG